MRSQIRTQLYLASQAMLYALSLLVLCKVIPEWGQWYVRYGYHRFQSAALLRGDLALSHHPSDLTNDLCWSKGGIHQVWGLGIALWRLPFDLTARALGFQAFPDRLVMAIFMAVVAYCALSTWIKPALDLRNRWLNGNRQGFASEINDPPRLEFRSELALGLGAVSLLLLFPPLLSLLQSRMAVYEEVMVYVHFVGTALVCGLVALYRRPRWVLFFVLCCLSGFGMLVRPTMLFCGAATVALAVWIMWSRNPADSVTRIQQSGQSVHAGYRYPRLFIGVALFLMFGGLLFATNALRFGNGFEFGHRLNLQAGDMLGSTYSTHFDSPYSHVNLIVAARELFGALFLVNNYDSRDCYDPGIFAGQSSVVRWRSFSFRTYDFTFFAVIFAAWLVAFVAVAKSWSLGGLRHKSDSCRAGNTVSIPTILAIWSVLVSAPLFVFYLRVPVIAERYMMDFSPAFSAALVSLWCLTYRWALSRSTAPRRAMIALLCVLAFWQLTEIELTTWNHDTQKSFSWADVRDDLFSPPVEPDLSGKYVMGESMSTSGVPFNGEGWNWRTGQTRPFAIFFVDSPEFIQMDLEPVDEGSNPSRGIDSIRVKVGLEFLQRKSAACTNGCWTVTFDAPRTKNYQKGLQVVFLATVPNEQLADTASPWILKRLCWRTDEHRKDP